MASFLCINAQVLLILFCLMHTLIDFAELQKIQKTGCFAIVEASNQYTKDGSSSCAGAWITVNMILTAASCLDQDGKLRLKVNGTIDVLVWQMVKKGTGPYYWNQEKNGTFKGKAIFHPNYKRVDGTTVYDMAYVKAFAKSTNHVKGGLCNPGGYVSELIALGRTSNNVTQWIVQKSTDKNIATVNSNTNGKGLSNLSIQGREYKLDPSKQFTTHLKITDRRKKEGTTGPISETIFSKEGLGGPILIRRSPTRICVGGIMTSKEVKNNEMYITATNVSNTPEMLNFFRYAFKLLSAAEKGSK